MRPVSYPGTPAMGTSTVSCASVRECPSTWVASPECPVSLGLLTRGNDDHPPDLQVERLTLLSADINR